MGHPTATGAISIFGYRTGLPQSALSRGFIATLDCVDAHDGSTTFTTSRLFWSLRKEAAHRLLLQSTLHAGSTLYAQSNFQK
ncbi:MAG TPA: hypothetical protein VMU82_07045 [Acetobacteraceae bacterium]|nr:hypothetical protein [Acetobacteraceae bacterium]